MTHSKQPHQRQQNPYGVSVGARYPQDKYEQLVEIQKQRGDKRISDTIRAALDDFLAHQAPRFGLVLVVLLMAFSAFAPPVAHAQELSHEYTAISANVLIGAATAGISAVITGEPFGEAFVKGAFGGAVSYTGKRISAAQFDGAGIAGRTVNAFGASIVRNSGAGRGMLDEIVLPVGPVTLYWTTATPRADAGLHTRVDISQAAYVGYLAWNDTYTIDWSASLSSGVPVFQTPGQMAGATMGDRATIGGRMIGGYERLGAVVVSDPNLVWTNQYATLLAHERTHVLQHDYVHIVSEPIESWAMGLVPGGSAVAQYVDVGFVGELIGMGIVAAMPDDLRRPTEAEAYYLAGQKGW